MKFNTDLAKRRIKRIQEVTRAAPSSIQDIADAIHLSKRWTLAYVNHLHGRRRIHIAEYRKRTGEYETNVALYRWSRGEDAVRPPAQTATEKARKQRAAIAADPDRRDVFLSRKRAMRRKPARDKLTSALFGAPA